jgi:4,5-DOPA dioxygenase extradiol
MFIHEPEFGFDWALDMNRIFKDKIKSKSHQDLIQFNKLVQGSKLAIPTQDHYLPLLYILGLQKDFEEPQFFNDKAVGGSLTMTSVLIQ